MHNFFHFFCILKCSAQREKLDICSIPHPHIHQCSCNQYQADPIFSALRHFSKPLFGISFCRQVPREGKHLGRGSQKSFVLPQPPPTLTSSPNMRCGPDRMSWPLWMKIYFLEDTFSKAYHVFLLIIRLETNLHNALSIYFFVYRHNK